MKVNGNTRGFVFAPISPLLAAGLLLLGGACAVRAQSSREPEPAEWIAVEPLTLKHAERWPDGIGSGFRAGTVSLSTEAGASHGLKIFGGRVEHSLALGSLAFGYIPWDVSGAGHWYAGNWEFRGELQAGAQYSPEPEWLGALFFHLRYNFATGSRFVPFIDASAGLGSTSIGRPDLGGNFEFVEQGAIGTHYFLTENLALTAEARLMHISSASIYYPNSGVNTIFGYIGLTWLF